MASRMPAVALIVMEIDTLADMEILFDGIPLDQVTTSMTINAPASILLAMYIAVAEKQGVPARQLRGTIQNDILKEYVARGTYIFPPGPSLRLAARNLATSSRKLLCALKKKARRSAKESTDIPASTAACT